MNGSGDVDLKHNDGQGHTLAKSESMATTTTFKSGFVQFCQLEEFLNGIFLNGNLPSQWATSSPLPTQRKEFVAEAGAANAASGSCLTNTNTNTNTYKCIKR